MSKPKALEASLGLAKFDKKLSPFGVGIYLKILDRELYWKSKKLDFYHACRRQENLLKFLLYLLTFTGRCSVQGAV